MALVTYKVEYGATYATCTTVATNVVSVNANIGRRRQLDQYNANTASVVLRYPTGYSSPNSSWISGTWVRISVSLAGTGVNRQVFTGRIADVSVEYGIPYQGGVGNADYVTLSLESNFAGWGRMQGNSFAMTANNFGTQMNIASSQTGLVGAANSQYGYFTSFPATTISGSWGDWINRCVLTMNGRIIDDGDSINPVNQYYKGTAVYGNFTGATNDAANHPFEQIQFSSYADNYYTQVNVVPESYTKQTVQTGAIPYRTYEVNTLNNSTGQALDYANYLLSTYKDPTLRIDSVTCNLNAQVGDVPGYGAGYVGTAVTVLFRGTTYNCIIEGSTWSGTPDHASVTFHFSSQDLNNYLLLNNTTYGRLDFNKLGY